MGSPLIIGNHGFSTANQMVPCCTTETHKITSAAPDFIMYDGTPNPIHTTYPIAYTPIAGSTDQALRTAQTGLWYGEIQPGPRELEYQGNPQWATTLSGGVMVDYIQPNILIGTDSAYSQVTIDNPPDGTRLNTFIEPFTNYREDPNLGGVWWGVNANGQVFKIDRSGNTTTIVGFKRDRSQLTYRQVEFSNPEAPSEAQIDTKRTVVGTFPPDVDLGGANDLVFDPRDRTGDTLYVVAQVDHSMPRSSSRPRQRRSTPARREQRYVEGNALTALFNQPTSIEMDSSGTMYVSDAGNYAIRKITAGGTVSTLCGGTVGPTPPSPSTAIDSRTVSVSSITWNSSTNIGTVVLTSGFTPANRRRDHAKFQPSAGQWRLWDGHQLHC